MRYGTLLLILIFLSGCGQPTAESMLKDYAQRVSNAIDHPIELDLAKLDYPSLPARRDRRLEIEELREGVIDVFRLRHCDLLPLISERNSNLGRVMPPSQRLEYELRFLPAIQQCEQRLLKQVHQDADLIPLLARVTEIRQHKEQQLPRVMWNAFYTSPEMEQQFSKSSTAIALDASGHINHIQQVMDPFIQLSKAAHTPAMALDLDATESLEKHFEQLYRTELGSQWLRSVALLTLSMNAVATGIEERLQQRPICFDKRPNQRASIIANVFTHFYAGQFQPYLARTDQFGQRWGTLQQQLLANLPAPESTQNYFSSIFLKDHPDGLLYEYEQAKLRHISAWQHLLDHCGLQVGNLTQSDR